ncbi:methyl-accepting chemotaxis protein [Seleniivibrio woodruffii]|uniref:methyl-accepting chemotaxis protein n=1 Tax=Seleniivibrio woodruffii TaxID=1078050 RepID=UPI002409EA51|nr:methyl-accepting chemotaxis protein [Seleniivibrio woodruffii]
MFAKSLRMKISLLVLLPVMIATLTVGISNILSIKNESALELEQTRERLMAEKKNELKQLVDLFLSAANTILKDPDLTEEEAAKRVQYLAYSINFGSDGYYFLYQPDGVLIANPMTPELEGKNRIDVKDDEGVPFIRQMIEEAQKGSGYVPYKKLKKSKNAIMPKLSYAAMIPELNWMVGTGFYIDDVDDKLAAIQAESAERVNRLIIWTVVISAASAVLSVLLAGFLLRSVINNIKNVGEVLGEISSGEGDLTKQLPVNSQDEVGRLSVYFNTFLMKLKEIISSIQSSSQSVASGSVELASATEELSVTIRDQAAQISGVAAATEQISISSEQIAVNLSNNVKLADKTEKNTEEGSRMLQKAVDEVVVIKSRVDELGQAIGRLADSSQEINVILNVISDIADQTNLLALNAAIEAARAGEHGRGFAVVADEVRKLAERTQSATGEISVIVENFRKESMKASGDMGTALKHVDSGVDTMKSISSFFDEIVASVKAMNDMNGVIETSIREQLSAISGINDNTQTISAGIEQSSNALHEISRTVNDLEMQSNDMMVMVGKFRV